MSVPTTDPDGVVNFGQVVLPPRPQTKWDREYAAYLKLYPELLKTYRDQYVAVHDGAVVGHGPDQMAVAMAAYQQFGPQDILVRLVTDAPPRVVYLPSIRVVRPEAV